MNNPGIMRAVAEGAVLVCIILSVGEADAIKLSVVPRSSGVSAAGSYSETEEGQGTVVTSHGAVSSIHPHGQERKEEKKIEIFAPSDWDIINQQLQESEIDPDNADEMLQRRDLTRERRFMSSNKRYAWPKAIVPFDFDMPNNSTGVYYRKEALAAMTKWHKYTCVRFVPWVEGETMKEYGLTKEWHVTITKGDGCASHKGNIRRSKGGQYNSCCGRYTCLHELGHTLALYHEHQNPLRGDVMELNWDRVPFKHSWTYRMSNPLSVETYEYDTSNTMHYGNGAFRILYEDLRPLLKFSNQYYMYKDVSIFHDCKEQYCPDFNQECHNDGFATLVDGQCSCLCPAGLDSSTGCATTIKQVTRKSEWPAGSYALLAPVEGCPADEFSEGSCQHSGKGGNSKSSDFHLAGSFEADTFQYEFCVKDDNSASATGPVWEHGRYCILRANGNCPDGFQTGFLQFDDATGTEGQVSGDLPDGEFTDDTRLEFCCRNDGFTSTPLLNVPNTQPLVLMMAQQSSVCQEIAGMRWTKEFMYFKSFPDKAEKNGSHPRVSGGTLFKTWFCHYVPVDLNCGGEITLTRANRQAVITSPNFPSPYGTNMECTWLIKTAESDGRILLNFNDMKVTTKEDDCEDSLEIRYNLPGQPGLRYCGDGIGRTIRSLNNTVILTLRTDHHQVAEDTGFNVTASLFIPEEDECFDPATKGRLYRGQKDYTRSMRPCLDWTQVTHCPHHAFNSSDFGAGLDINHCRNPDNTAMPWCYTDLNCNRDYCDVCNVERIYDRGVFCSDTLCLQTEGEIHEAGCAATCNLQAPAAPIRHETCGEPGTLPDADIVQPAGQSASSSGSYGVGDSVTYKCRTGNETLQRTCMSDGEWSPAGYVCGACDDGWAFHRGACYKFYLDSLVFSEAQTVCKAHGALVSSMKDEAEQSFVASLRNRQWTMWIGATDVAEEGTYVWQDGTPVEWANWKSKDTPNNKGKWDCVDVNEGYRGNLWDGTDCLSKRPFVCKYTLSETQTCADRHPDCGSVLLDVPETCTTHPDFASIQCPYTCGLCQPNATPQCDVDPPSDDVQLVSPEGQVSATRGSIVRYACRDGYIKTQGQLVLACGHDGHFIGQLPVCADPETIVQDSNDAELIPRSKITGAKHAYISVAFNMGIHRHGVIKQWKFFSPQPGWSMFQVWRPNPAGGNFSFNLVGQNLFMTSGRGEETKDVDEADWIHVQPGDRIGLWEPKDTRGNVPFDNCDGNKQPEDYGSVHSAQARQHGDFSPLQAMPFRSHLHCRVFSFKAVIYPVDSVPAHPQLVTSQVPLLDRVHVGSPSTVYLGDSNYSYVPADGVISEWQFFVRSSGSAAFQVWRGRSDLGVRKYEFVGQNVLRLTVDTPHRHTHTVPGGERIAVKAGDIIAILYGSNKLGVPFNICQKNKNPESDNVSWFQPLTPDTVEVGKVYTFSYTKSWLCRVFSFRAVVTQTAQQDAS